MCEKKSYDASVLLWVPDDLFFPKKGPLGRQGASVYIFLQGIDRKTDRQTDRKLGWQKGMDGWMDRWLDRYINLHVHWISQSLTPSSASTTATPTPTTASASTTPTPTPASTSAETSKYCATNENRPDRFFNFIRLIGQSVFILIFFLHFLVIIF